MHNVHHVAHHAVVAHATSAIETRLLVVAGILLTLTVLYTVCGMWKREPIMVFSGIISLLGYVLLTAPFGFLLSYFMGSV